MSCASNAGRPKVGYETKVLIKDLQNFLDYNNTKDAVIVGAGGLGRALLGYDGFKSYGLNIVAAFDVDSGLCGKQINGKTIFHVDKLPELVKRMNIHIGIITSPAETAQDICDTLVKSGVLAIWNFAPVSLTVPSGIIVQSENMATSLAILSNRLNEVLRG